VAEPQVNCPLCQSSGKITVSGGCKKCGSSILLCNHDGFATCEACRTSCGPFSTPQKAPSLNRLLDGVAKMMSGKKRQVGKCAGCGGEAKDFRNDLSRQEYGISMLCQNCQDEVFGA
jgi:hypothetical protein